MIPRMTRAERAAYSALLKDAPLVVEYGCGGSTQLACEAGVPLIVSIDSDKAWLAKIREAPEFAQHLDRICLCHGNIGETRHWGYPVAAVVTREQAANYHSNFWLTFLKGKKARATVLIDGRFRAACAFRALLSTAPGSFICFHDYAPRPYYHAVEDLLSPVNRVDDMAVFQTPADLDRDAALKLYSKYFHDHR